MDVKIEDVSSVKKEITIEIDAERVDEEIAKTYKKIAKNAKVKGFRPGKVPQKVIEQYYADQMEHEVVNTLIREALYKALLDQEIPAISEPEIIDAGTLEKGSQFSFTAQVEVKPEVEAKDYTGLELKKEILQIDDDVVDKKVLELLDSRNTQEIAQRDDAQNGDFLTIDFEGFIDGEAFEGGAAQDHVLELGSGSFIPGFEEQLVGMKRGEEKEITVTFPQEYGNKDLAGKEAMFKVALKEIKVKVVPELDDEMAKEFGCEDAEDMRNKIAESNEKQEVQRIEDELKERLMTALVENNPIEVPDVMVERQLEFMKRNIANRLKQQGMSLEMMGMNDQSFAAMYRDTATKQVQGSLILEAIGKQENISVDESEIDSRMEEIAEMANAPLEEVKKYYASDEARNNLMAQIEEEKVITYLLGQANVQEVSKEELQEEAAATVEE